MPYDDRNHPIERCEVCRRDFCLDGTDADECGYCRKECEARARRHD
jgi:hypothetical protein